MKFLILDEKNVIINIVESDTKLDPTWKDFNYKAEIGQEYKELDIESLSRRLDKIE